ncbi:MAG: hypothetical protein LBN71_07435, partial [Tannerella sp.]|nr:hypothetical protein [Tannerella sp.]
IQYGDKENDFLYSNSSGKFHISFQKAKELRLQIHHISYHEQEKIISVGDKQLIILLEPKVNELDEVEVTFTFVNALLDKAVFNTKRKLLTGQYVSYLGHVIQTEESNKETKECYYKYFSYLKTVQPKREKISYKFFLTALKHVQSIPKHPKSLFLRDGKGLNLWFHAVKMNNKTGKEDIVNYAEFENDSLLVLTAVSKKDGRKKIFYINKSDTTLHSYSVYYEADSYKNQGLYKFRDKDVHYSVRFGCIDGKYFMSHVNAYFLEECIFNDKKRENIVTFLEINHLEISKKKYDEIKKIEGNTRELFLIDSTTDETFW